jgi:hypothetical protein
MTSSTTISLVPIMDSGIICKRMNTTAFNQARGIMRQVGKPRYFGTAAWIAVCSSYPCRSSVDRLGSSVLVSVTLPKSGIGNGGKMNIND